VATARQTRPRSVLTAPSGETRDHRRQQVWLDWLRDVRLVARHKRPPRILVVDDNRDMLDMLRVLLEGEGAVVETALSGADALSKAEASQIDLLISDISMPGMDGYKLLKELREQSRYANVPAIALTGFGQEEDVERARQAGFTTHLTKPLYFEHLVRLACVILRQ
jgi:two-component system, chemotaxis family, CheB/CheR fusion protein